MKGNAIENTDRNNTNEMKRKGITTKTQQHMNNTNEWNGNEVRGKATRGKACKGKGRKGTEMERIIRTSKTTCNKWKLNSMNGKGG